MWKAVEIKLKQEMIHAHLEEMNSVDSDKRSGKVSYLILGGVCVCVQKLGFHYVAFVIGHISCGSLWDSLPEEVVMAMSRDGFKRG